MKEYKVYAEFSVIKKVTVLADSEEEAKQLALKENIKQSFKELKDSSNCTIKILKTINLPIKF